MEPEVAGGSDVSPPTDAEVAAGEAVGEAEADAEKMQAEANAASEEEGAAADAGEAGTMTPEEAVKNTPQGELKNPYTDYQSVAEEGHKLYMGLSCNGCHGGTGGGGMCPPLTNPVWVYGADDDTLFRIVTVGSDGLQKDYGMTRKGSENVVGPMPAMGSAIKSEDDLWKIIAWIRSVNPDSLKEKKPPPMPEGLE
ncbi:c-type cytochrome [Methyloligella sp. GL2]|nr:c-type cytochrome [Methyloligella sp. GL2]